MIKAEMNQAGESTAANFDTKPQPLSRVQIELVATSAQLHSVWAGGETRQLAIYPPHATLAARDFEYRISSALVQQGGFFSDFTGFWRHLALLDGDQMQLTIGQQRFCLASDAYQVQFAGHEPCYATLLPHNRASSANLPSSAVSANDSSTDLNTIGLKVTDFNVIDFNVIVKAPWQARLHRIDHELVLRLPSAQTDTANPSSESHWLLYSLAPYRLSYSAHSTALTELPAPSIGTAMVTAEEQTEQTEQAVQTSDVQQWHAAAGDAIRIAFTQAVVSNNSPSLMNALGFMSAQAVSPEHDMALGYIQISPHLICDHATALNSSAAPLRRHPVYLVQLYKVETAGVSP
jgi:hypothetical protein